MVFRRGCERTGLFFGVGHFLLFFFSCIGLCSDGYFDWVLAVTVVESGSRALQYLGLDGEKSSIGFDVSGFFNC